MHDGKHVPSQLVSHEGSIRSMPQEARYSLAACLPGLVLVSAVLLAEHHTLYTVSLLGHLMPRHSPSAWHALLACGSCCHCQSVCLGTSLDTAASYGMQCGEGKACTQAKHPGLAFTQCFAWPAHLECVRVSRPALLPRIAAPGIRLSGPGRLNRPALPQRVAWPLCSQGCLLVGAMMVIQVLGNLDACRPVALWAVLYSKQCVGSEYGSQSHNKHKSITRCNSVRQLAASA